MDSAQQSRLSSSSSSLSSPRIKEATIGAVNKKPGTETETRSSVLQYPNLSVSAEESVFCIDHILELILGDCDRQTLLNCRLVCRRWAYYGSKSLQKIVTLAFTHKHDQLCYVLIEFEFDSDQKYSTEDLTALMNNSTEFPCNSFTFSNYSYRDRSSHTPQPFLNDFGYAIKKIEFEGMISFRHLRQLLLTQAPNLEQLHLSSISILELPHKDSIGYNLTPAERAIAMQTHFTESDNIVILKNLKVFESSSNIPKLFTQQILEASPNLVQVSLPSEYLDILVKPINRLHLLKKLHIKIDKDNIEAFESVANYHGDNLALEELEFSAFDYKVYDLYDRVMDVTAKILKASCASCHQLTWNQFLCRAEMPDMPRVKQLTLGLFADEDYYGLPIKALPDGVSIGETFPNLKSLNMRGSGRHLTLEEYLSYDSLVPVEGVRSVYWNIFPEDDVNIFPSLIEMFPNAAIRIASLEDCLESGIKKYEPDYGSDCNWTADFYDSYEHSSNDETDFRDRLYDF